MLSEERKIRFFWIYRYTRTYNYADASHFIFWIYPAFFFATSFSLFYVAHILRTYSLFFFLVARLYFLFLFSSISSCFILPFLYTLSVEVVEWI